MSGCTDLKLVRLGLEVIGDLLVPGILLAQLDNELPCSHELRVHIVCEVAQVANVDPRERAGWETARTGAYCCEVVKGPRRWWICRPFPPTNGGLQGRLVGR
jgi:hypothetical protein